MNPCSRSALRNVAEWVPRLFVCAVLGTAPILANRPFDWTFDDMRVGHPPAGFDLLATGGTKEGKWEVTRDGSNTILAQLAPADVRASSRLALVRDVSLRDVSLAVRLKPGGVGRSAGIIWRYSSEGDYYLARLDLAEQEVSLYRVLRGNRSRLEDREDLELDASTWHTLKIEHRGERVRLWLNGIPVANTRDRTIDLPGRVGVWTNGDSTAWFDDLRAASLLGAPPRTPARSLAGAPTPRAASLAGALRAPRDGS